GASTTVIGSPKRVPRMVKSVAPAASSSAWTPVNATVELPRVTVPPPCIPPRNGGGYRGGVAGSDRLTGERAALEGQPVAAAAAEEGNPARRDRVAVGEVHGQGVGVRGAGDGDAAVAGSTDADTLTV